MPESAEARSASADERGDGRAADVPVRPVRKAAAARASIVASAVASTLATALALLAPVVARAADDFAPVTPYRPTVSDPAQLPAPGQLELEVGGLRQRADDQRRSSLPYLLKLAWSAEWGILVGGEAAVWQRDTTGSAGASDSTRGVGDTTLTLKRAWTLDEQSALGLEFGVKLPTARQGIGSGHADAALNAIWSRDIGPAHLDLNLNGARLGTAEPGSSRWQTGASAAVSTTFYEHWGLTGELSGTRRSGAPGGRQLLAAITFSPTRLLTLDLGLARAARPAPATTSLFLGAVFPLAKLW